MSIWLQHVPPTEWYKGGQIGAAGTDTAGGGGAPGGAVSGGCNGGISVRGVGGGRPGGRHAPRLRSAEEQQIELSEHAPDAGGGTHRVRPPNA
jgi:hypothetical protein